MLDVGSTPDRSNAEKPGQRGELAGPAPVDADASRRRGDLISWLLGGLLLAIVIVPALVWRGELAGLFTDRSWVMALVRDAGAWGPAALMGLTVAQIIAAPIPGQAVNLVAGYAFGFWWGALYSWLATLIGSTAALALARYAGRPLVVRLVSPHALDRLDRYAAGRGLGFFFLVFLIPFLPDDVACFLAGLTPLPLRALIAVVALGRIPGVLTAVWAGSQADRLAGQGWLVAGALIVLGLFVAVRFGRRLQNALLRWLSQRIGS